jgi:hypothetical protein
MSPADLALAEREAYARLRREASEEAHEDWLEVRRAIFEHCEVHGRIDDLDTLTSYSLQVHHRRVILRIRPLCHRSFLEWSYSGASSCSKR